MHQAETQWSFAVGGGFKRGGLCAGEPDFDCGQSHHTFSPFLLLSLSHFYLQNKLPFPVLLKTRLSFN